MRITFVGLGNMGAALMRAHLKAGSQCTIWNRSPNKPIVSELEKEGATFEKELHRAITMSQYLVICLPDHESAYKCFEALSPGDEMFSHLKAIVNLSNGSPKDSETMKAWTEERMAKVYIAGAIMAGPDNIGDRETAFVLYSGDIPEDIENEIEQLINAWGRPEYVGTAVRNAQIYNNASLAATYSLFSGVLLSTAILSAASSESSVSGRIMKPFQSYVTPLLKPAVSEVDDMAQAVEDDNEDAMGAAVSMVAASLRNLSRTCTELGIDSGGMEHFYKVCEQVVNNGEGEKGMTAVAKMMMKKQ